MSTVLSEERITSLNIISRRLNASILADDNNIPPSPFYTIPVNYIKDIKWSVEGEAHAVLKWASTDEVIFKLSGNGHFNLENTDYIFAPSGSDILWFESEGAKQHDVINIIITSRI